MSDKIKRLDYLDMTKGLGMILVLVGHLQGDSIFTFSPYIQPLCAFIFSFHMPMFFFLSGIFLSAPNADSPKDKAFWVYIWKKTKRLLAMYCLFFGIAVISMAVFEHQIYPAKRILKAFLGYRLQTFHNGYQRFHQFLKQKPFLN